MPSSGMLRRVTLVRTDISEELSASIIRVIRIGELGKSVLTRATLRNIPKDVILHSHRRENLKSYKIKATADDVICLHLVLKY
jgi:DNA-binding TFAR19-related protein (PDSD5 family)